MADITILTQPISENLEPGESPSELLVSASTDGSEELTYQWYSCDDAEKTNPVAISDAVAAAYTPAAPTPGDTDYYYCVVDASDATEASSDVAEIFLEGAIVITLQPLSETVGGGDDPTPLVITATTTGEDALTYQWYSCANALKATPVAISEATSTSYDPGSLDPGYTYYYFCRVDADDADPVDSNVAAITQNGKVPVLILGGDITNKFANDYIAQCSAEVQARFVDEQIFTGITIPATNEGVLPLRTAQLELFYRVI